jgi:cephalosporin hydroxylase
MSIIGESFPLGRAESVSGMATDLEFQRLSQEWFLASLRHRYSYQFDWLGRPIIQYPPDVLAVQELLWRVKPDLVVETGVAHGGSAILSASILELLGGDREVVAIDIDIRQANRREIEAHPLAKRITLLEGSSVDDGIAAEVRRRASGRQSVMVLLDSNHTHEHVLRELELYAPLVTPGSYAIVFDTVVEDLPAEMFADRPWGPGNSPKTAVHEFLRANPHFEIDRDVEAKLLLTVAPDGYLRRV